MLPNSTYIYRCYYQVQTWLRNQLEPTEWGWKRNGGGSLSPIAMTHAPASEKLLQLISCNRAEGCKSACSCRKAGKIFSVLACTSKSTTETYLLNRSVIRIFFYFSGLKCSSICFICQRQNCSNAILLDVISADNPVDDSKEQSHHPQPDTKPRTKIWLPYTVNVKMKNQNKIVCDGVIRKFNSPLEK